MDVPSPVAGPASERTSFSKTISNLPVIRRQFPWRKALRIIKAALSLIVAAAVIWFFVSHPIFKKIGHETSQFFNAVGVTKPALGEGFSLQNIRSERRFEDGGMHLIVEGDVHNDNDELRPMPDINVNALGPDKKIIQSWRIEAPAATLAAGAVVPFRSSIVAPEGTVMEVNLSFIEPHHDSKP